MNRRSRPRSAFTLLEVLAAVAILGVLYVVLADVAIQGLRAEGRSRRRMEASLVADRALSEIEIEIEAGGVPELGRLPETEEDMFRIAVEVRPYSIPLVGGTADAGSDTGSPSEGGALASLREIELTVTWDEGVDELQVVRTTYAFDAAGASSQLFEAAPPQEGES
jgi:prepilin-type N-terminal cleavage/methylation domain-containing protein